MDDCDEPRWLHELQLPAQELEGAGEERVLASLRIPAVASHAIDCVHAAARSGLADALRVTANELSVRARAALAARHAPFARQLVDVVCSRDPQAQLELRAPEPRPDHRSADTAAHTAILGAVLASSDADTCRCLRYVVRLHGRR